jgi:hypothetical protein
MAGLEDLPCIRYLNRFLQDQVGFEYLPSVFQELINIPSMLHQGH